MQYNIITEIDRLKEVSVEYVTNIYNLDQLNQANHVSGFVSDRCALWIIEQNNYYRLFYAGDKGTVRANLRELKINLKSPLVADVVSRSSESDIFQATDFRKYSMLSRLAMRNVEVAELYPQQAAYISNKQINDIEHLLKDEFDVFVDQIPQRPDIEGAVKRNEILGALEMGSLAGFLWYETVGRTSVIRYWCVAPAYRDKKVGAKLLRSYLSQCASSQRHLLWVKATNENAIKRYNHYGYRPDGTFDLVYIRERKVWKK
ncbi:MAG: GNAT family N-acetyltransferase [Cloacibacillus sp.]